MAHMKAASARAMAMTERPCTVHCDLEAYRCPHPILLKREAARFSMRQFASGAGVGRHTSPLGDHRRMYRKPERVSNQPQRAQGVWPMCSWAFTDAVRPSCQSTLRRLTPCTSSEASGSPTPLTTPGETCAYRRPVGVVTCHRRHAPASGPEPSTRCSSRGCSPAWSGTSGRRDGPGARSPPLLRRPP